MMLDESQLRWRFCPDLAANFDADGDGRDELLYNSVLRQ
jgi:hypothetical protein